MSGLRDFRHYSHCLLWPYSSPTRDQVFSRSSSQLRAEAPASQPLSLMALFQSHKRPSLNQSQQLATSSRGNGDLELDSVPPNLMLNDHYDSTLQQAYASSSTRVLQPMRNNPSTSRINPETRVPKSLRLVTIQNLRDDDSDGAGSVLNLKEEAQSCRSELESRCSSESQDALSNDSDVESTMDLYLNVELGVVSDLEDRNKCLKSIAEVKKSVAKTERRLAQYCKKEVSLIQKLHTVHENIAQKRQLQADLNIDQLGHYFKVSQKYGTNGPSLRGTTLLSEVVTTLARPTESFL